MNENSPMVCPSPSARRQSPRLLDVGLLGLIDQLVAFGRASPGVADRNPLLAMLKCRRRVTTSFFALAVDTGVHSVTTWKLAWIFSSWSSTIGRVSPGCLLHRQQADEVVSHPKMVALGLDVGVDDLEVEELRGIWAARNAPRVEVEQPAKECELALLVQRLDLHEVRQMPDEMSRPGAPSDLHVGFDLLAQQNLHLLACELRPDLAACLPPGRTGSASDAARGRSSTAGPSSTTA